VSDLPELLFSWEKHLRAEGKSKATVKAYGDGIRFHSEGSEHEPFEPRRAITGPAEHRAAPDRPGAP
jgi:hypothetical protein